MEQFILVIICTAIFLSVFYIPKDKLRLAFVSFLAFQATTWAFVIVLTQIGTLEFPLREFVRATRINFIAQFLFYPAVFTWFILLFPQKILLKKVMHYLVFVSIPIWFVYFISLYTNMERFAKGTPRSQVVRMYISFSVQFSLCHLYVIWLSKKVKLTLRSH